MSPAPLGSLFVNLGLNSAEFTGGMTKAEFQLDKFNRKIEGAVGGALRGFAAQLLAVGTAFEIASRQVQAFNNAVVALDKLDEAAQKLGSSASELSKLESVTLKTGENFDLVTGAAEKLIKGLSGADDETKGAAGALKFLGLSAKDAAGDLKDPAILIQEIAKRLDTYRDSASKTALAQELFGKSGAALIPFLNDLAKAGTLVATVTDEQAASAAALKDAQAELSAEWTKSTRALSLELIPALTIGLNALTEVKRESNALKSDGAIASWAQTSVRFLGSVADAAVELKLNFNLLFLELEKGWLRAQSVFNRAAGFARSISLSSGNREDGAAQSSLGLAQSAAADEILAEENKIRDQLERGISRFRDAIANAQRDAALVAKGAGGAFDDARDRIVKAEKAVLKFGGSSKTAGAEVSNGLGKSLDELFNKLNSVDDELQKQIALLSKGFQTGAISAAKFAEGVALAFSQSKSVKDFQKNIDELNKSLDEIEDRRFENLQDAQAFAGKQFNDLKNSIEKANEALKDEIATLGMTTTEQKLYNLEKQKAAILINETDEKRRESLVALIDEQIQLTKNSAAIADQQKTWGSLSQTVEGFFEDLFTNGKDAFGNLWQTVKRFFAQMAAQFATKFVLNAALNLTAGGAAGGLAGAAGAAVNAISGSGGGLSQFGPIGSALSGISTLLGGSSLATAGGVFSSVLSGTGSVLQGLTAGLSSLTGGATAFLGVLGPIGVAAGALAAVWKPLFGRKLKDFGIEANLSQSGVDGRQFEFFKGGLFRSDKTVYKPLEEQFLKSLSDATKSVFDTVGGLASGLGLDTDALASVTGSFRISTKGKSDEEIQKLVQAEFDKLTVSAARALDFSSLDKKIEEYIESFEGTGEELVKYIQKVAAAKPIFDELSQSVPNFTLALSDFLELTDTQIQALALLGATLPALATDAFAEVDRIIADSFKGTVTRFDEMGDSVTKLITDFNDGKLSIEQLAGAGAEFATAFAAATAKIADTQAQLNSLFNSTREGFLLDGLAVDKQYEYFQERANALAEQLAKAIDPEQIDSLTRQILDYQSRASGLLSQEERARLSPEFIAGLDRVQALANERLAAASARLNEESKPIKDQIAEALAAFIEANKDAADTNLVASENNLEASQTPRRLEVVVTNARGGIVVRETGQ